MRIFEFELTMKGRAGCIFKYKHNSIPLAEFNTNDKNELKSHYLK